MAKFPRSRVSTPGKSAGSIRVTQNTYRKALFKKLLSQLALVVLVLFAVYLCFAATIVRAVPASNGFTVVKNNTYPGGTLPADSAVLITLNPDKPIKSGIVDRLQQSFLPQKDTAIVKVLAGPSGKLKWVEPGILTVDGKPLPATFPTDPGFPYLGTTNEDGSKGFEYAAVCIEGACQPGQPLFFRSSNVYGVPIKESNLAQDPAWERMNAPGSQATEGATP